MAGLNLSRINANQTQRIMENEKEQLRRNIEQHIEDLKEVLNGNNHFADKCIILHEISKRVDISSDLSYFIHYGKEYKKHIPKIIEPHKWS